MKFIVAWNDEVDFPVKSKTKITKNQINKKVMNIIKIKIPRTKTIQEEKNSVKYLIKCLSLLSHSIKFDEIIITNKILSLNCWHKMKIERKEKGLKQK